MEGEGECASEEEVRGYIKRNNKYGSAADTVWDANACCKEGYKTVKDAKNCLERKRDGRLALAGCLSALFVGILCFIIGIFVGRCIAKRKPNQGGGGGQYAPPPNQQPMYAPPSQQPMYAPPSQQLMYGSPPSQPPMYAPPPNQQYANQPSAAQQS